MKHLIIILILLSSSGCGEIKKAFDSIGDEVTDPINNSVDDAIGDIDGSEPQPEIEAQKENPIVSGVQIFGKNGNLWKPVSDNPPGNLVVLFDSKFPKLFSRGCYATLKSGKKDFLWCNQPAGSNCFSNPNRMTLRGNYKCSEYKSVRVVCEEEKQTVIFEAPQGQKKNTCKRLG